MKTLLQPGAKLVAVRRSQLSTAERAMAHTSRACYRSDASQYHHSIIPCHTWQMHINYHPLNRASVTNQYPAACMSTCLTTCRAQLIPPHHPPPQLDAGCSSDQEDSEGPPRDCVLYTCGIVAYRTWRNLWPLQCPSHTPDMHGQGVPRLMMAQMRVHPWYIGYLLHS